MPTKAMLVQSASAILKASSCHNASMHNELTLVPAREDNYFNYPANSGKYINIRGISASDDKN